MSMLGVKSVGYVPHDDALAIFWIDGPAVYGTEVAEGIVVSFDKDGKPVGIEFESGARALVEEIVAQGEKWASKNRSTERKAG